MQACYSVIRKRSSSCAPPLLFFGPPSCGKTSIAEILAKEFGSKFHTIFGSREVTPPVLVTRFREAKHGDVMFIDEVHSLPKPTQETLFMYLDKQKLPALNDDGRVDTTQLEKAEAVNLILATTWPGSSSRRSSTASTPSASCPTRHAS